MYNVIYNKRLEGIPFILVNGRISNNSYKKWHKFIWVARELLSCFSLLLGQSEQDKQRLQYLSHIPAQCVGNIKYAGMPLPIDEKVLSELKLAVQNRPVFLISSTHDDEETQLATYLPKLVKAIPNILIIIVPRHPHRGNDITSMLAPNFKVEQRSHNGKINADTAIYVADTIGEMGLWYKLASVSFVGGSLIAHGGQNFIEPARDSNAVILGPHMHNFAEMLTHAQEAQAIIQVKTAEEVINQAIQLFSNTSLLEQKQTAALNWAIAESQVLDKICEVLKQELER